MKQETIAFLSWLSKRLRIVHRYSSDNNIILSLDKAIKYISEQKQYSFDISDKDLDLILSKYYSDFFLGSCDNLKIGYTDQQRKEIRTTIKKIVCDVINKDIPNNPIIKG
jgi:hypothetical protein